MLITNRSTARTTALIACTLTGVDETTSLATLASLSAEFPFVEWGFLYSQSQQGTPGRYPSVAFIRNALSTLPTHVRVALHVCGRAVQDLLAGQSDDAEELVALTEARGGRIQLNFNLTAGTVSVDSLRSFIDRRPALKLITQHHAANAAVVATLQPCANHAVLFDTSGGRGMLPTGWSVPLAGVSCGYAGGLGPDTLAEQLELIAIAAGDVPFWIDMEGQLRTPAAGNVDRFDLDKARRCLEVVDRWRHAA